MILKSIKENREEEKSQKSSSLLKENNEKKGSFLNKKRKETDTPSNIEDKGKIISSEEIEKPNNPESPIQNNNESFVVKKILHYISSIINNDSDVSKIILLM